MTKMIYFISMEIQTLIIPCYLFHLISTEKISLLESPKVSIEFISKSRGFSFTEIVSYCLLNSLNQKARLAR